MNTISDKLFSWRVNPYRLFFPLASIAGGFGVLTWILFRYQWMSQYPREIHAHLMYFGFLWTFVAGFLMTAIPKMTQTLKAEKVEIGLIYGSVVLQILCLTLNLMTFSNLVFTFQNLVLFYFIARRFLKTRRIPFEGILFIPMGFLMLGFGFVFIFIFPERGQEALYLFAGEAFILNLIVGLGSRLIPSISKSPEASLPTDPNRERYWRAPVLIGIFLNFGYLLQFFGHLDLGLLVRAVVIAYVVVINFQMLKRFSKFTVVGLGLKIGSGFLVLSHLLMLSYFNSKVAAAHLLYIGGFTLITFMVGTRVRLAHGSQSLDYELKSLRMIFVVGSLVLAAVLRWLAGVEVSSPFLLQASTLFLIVILLWSYKFSTFKEI